MIFLEYVDPMAESIVFCVSSSKCILKCLRVLKIQVEFAGF